MKALVYHGPGKRALEEKPKPAIQAPTDAIVKITKTTICGTDLHILKGDVPTVTDGRTLGHEGVGVIDQAGDAVGSFRPGDRVLISCITSCGRCANCKKGMYSHCENGGGWILGNTIDGTQAEYVRIPFADTSLYKIPEGVDEEALTMLSDILPTGFECGVQNGEVKPGDIVAIVGAGPIGLAALTTAQLYSPAEVIMIDLDDNRLEVSKKFGATKTSNSSDGRAVENVMGLTQGKGVDVAIEAVGKTGFANLKLDTVAIRGFNDDELVALLEGCGLEVRRASYCNFFLFPLLVARRTLDRWLGRHGSDVQFLPAPLEALFRALLLLEARLVRLLPLPVGSSVVAIARRRP